MKGKIRHGEVMKGVMIIWNALDRETKEVIMRTKYFQEESIELNIRRKWAELDKTARELITIIILLKISK